MSYLVQSVIFDKSKFSLEDARNWLLSNKYKDKGVDEKKNFWRFRQLNPLTIKRKGFSHYITKPLDSSGVELIIAYKEKMEGAGKLNQIKKALFKHFKADEKLEKEVASSLSKTNKEFDELLKTITHHDVADDKPQAQIRKELSKLNSNNIINISGKGFKKKSSIYSKDKMTTQEAKLYMSGILTTGGALDATQDVAFRLKYSFKVGELRKMLRELVKEKKIELDLKEISKLKKDEIIDMVVKGKLITPPALPTSVALGKKYKMADLKREVLKHAGLGDFKKADIINYIEKNKLFEVEEQPNIQLAIEEIVEEAPKVKKSKKTKRKLILEEEEEPKKEEIKLIESEPTGNPKLQMKGIKVGTRVMPKKDEREYVKLDWTDEEISLLPTIKPNNQTTLEAHIYLKALSMSKDGKVPLELKPSDRFPNHKGKDTKFDTYRLYRNRVYLNGMRLTGYDKMTPEEKEKKIDEEIESLNQSLDYFRKKAKKLAKAKSKEEKVEAPEKAPEVKVEVPKKAPEEKEVDNPKYISRRPRISKNGKEAIFDTIELKDKLGNWNSNLIIDEDDKYIYHLPDINLDPDEDVLSTIIADDGTLTLSRYDKTRKRFKKDEFELASILDKGIKELKITKFNGDEIELKDADKIKEYLTNPENLAPDFEKKKKPEKKSIEKEDEYVVPDLTDEEISIMKRNSFTSFSNYKYPIKNMKDGKILTHYIKDRGEKFSVPLTLINRRLYIEDEYIAGKSPKELEELVKRAESRFVRDLDTARKRYEKIDNPTEGKKTKSKKEDKETGVKLSQTEEVLKERYMKEKDYSEEDAIEAALRDTEYQKTIDKLVKEGKYADETEYPEKPLTNREIGDVREKSYFTGQYERLKKDSAFKKKVEDNQAKLIAAMNLADVDPNTIPRPVLSVMIYKSLDFNPKNLREAFKYLNYTVRGHEKYKINE